MPFADSHMDTSFSSSSLLGAKTYLGRIKDPNDKVNLHSKQDLIHAIIFDDPEEDFDFMDLKKVVEEDNGLILYTTLVDRSKKQQVTWGKCMDVLKNKPPVGRNFIAIHERPLSFGSFAEMAYSKAILSNAEAYDQLKSRISSSKTTVAPSLPPPSGSSCKRSTCDPSVTAVRNGIETAISIKETFDPSALPPMSSASKQLTFISPVDSSHVGSNVVIGGKESEFGELSREFWQERALKAEKEVKELAEKNAVQKDELIELRNALSKASGLKEGFAANSDLAQVAVRETQALAAKAIIDGLKPEFNTLPKMTKIVEELTAKINALSKLPELVATLVELPAKVSALEASIDASVVRSIEGEDARNSDSENISCSIKRVHRLMSNFGFSSENKAFNVPDAVSSILSLVRSEFSTPAHDTSRPPPSVPGPSSSSGHDYHLIPRNNNNPAPSGLMPTTSGSGDFEPGHVPYRA